MMGGSSDNMNVAKKPQAIILSDSDDEYQQYYQPPKDKLVDVRIEI